MIAHISRAYLLFLSLVFTFLAFYLLTSPSLALSDHGLDLTNQPISAFAEIRAYYFGTMGLIALQCMRGAYWKSNAWERKNSLLLSFTLLWLFVVARMYSYMVDGPPDLAHAYATWFVEVLGAAISIFLYSVEEPLSKKVR